jgi:hypothetical protein
MGILLCYLPIAPHSFINVRLPDGTSFSYAVIPALTLAWIYPTVSVG